MPTEATIVQYEAAEWGGILRIMSEKLGEREAGVVDIEAQEVGRMCRWRIAVDCRRVTFLPSSGIGILVRLYQRCRESGGALAVFGLNQQLLDLMKLTGVDRLMKVVPDEAAAAKVLKK